MSGGAHGPLEIVPLAAQRVVPWRNGGGSTREVALAPDGDGFRWRVSVARVEADGPFSLFPGIDRRLWLLAGAGMDLDVDGTITRLAAPFATIAFPGEARVHARLLAGPTEDLNVMVARGARAEVDVCRLPAGTVRTWAPPHPGTRLVLALAGSVVVASAGARVTLTVGDATRQKATPAGSTWHVHATGTASVLLAALS